MFKWVVILLFIRNEIYRGGEGKTGPAMAFWVASYLQEYWSAVETNDVVVSNMVLHLAERQEGVLHSAWIPPPSVEAKAYEASGLLARHLGLQAGVLEGDSLIISNALKRVTKPSILVSAIVDSCFRLRYWCC
uniref:RNase H type-1 domain-containing protein n=1 Tax=Quercus lobata TaxID=97700 RepID=A0A7N2M9D6_QUELO